MQQNCLNYYIFFTFIKYLFNTIILHHDKLYNENSIPCRTAVLINKMKHFYCNLCTVWKQNILGIITHSQ